MGRSWSTNSPLGDGRAVADQSPGERAGRIRAGSTEAGSTEAGSTEAGSAMSADLRSWLRVLAVLGGLALVAVVGVAALAPNSTETQVFPGVPVGDPPAPGTPEASTAVVVGKRTSGGTSLLGLHFGRRIYRVNVQFFAPPGCWQRIDFGDRWPTSEDECSSDVVVEGEVTGLGNAPTGESIVFVDVDVVRDCFDVVTAGVAWPTDLPACADDHSQP
jgi:hypothetical protein